MKPCRFPNQCPHEATATCRIAGVGDRDVCDEHQRWMTAQGQDFRVLETNAYVPEWRQRSLASDRTEAIA